MEVDVPGFSIREYTRKTRSVDVDKCWPFSRDLTGDRVRSILPPITVVRFRWWSHELSVLRAAAAAAAEYGRPRRGCKAKSRQQKKRSIVEIFAAAPKIHRGRCEDDGDSYADSCNIRLMNLKRKRKKDQPHVLQHKKMANKESICNEHTRVPFCEKMDGQQCNLGNDKETSDVALTSKKTGLQCSSYSELGRLPCSTKSIVKDQNLGFQLPGILKTKIKVCTVNNPDQLNLPVVQCEKHVRFSDQCGMISQRKKNVASLDSSFCSLEMDASSLSCSHSSNKDQPSSNERELPLKSNNMHNDDVHTDPKQQNKFRHEISERHLTEGLEKCDFWSLFRPHLSVRERIKHASDKPLHPPELGITPDYAKVAADGCMPVTTSTSNLGWKSADYHADNVLDFSTAGGERKVEIAPDFRSFISTLNDISNQRNSLLCQPTCKYIHCGTPQYWSSCDQFPVEWMQKAVVHREKQVEDMFMGFPLNLQGELVSADKLCPRRVDQQLLSGFGTGSSKTLSQVRGVDLFPLNENRPKYFPARLGVDDTFSEKADVISDNNYRELGQPVHSPSSDLTLNGRWIKASAWSDLIENHNRKSMLWSRENKGDMLFCNSPTMRLMGKDFTVGTSSSDLQILGSKKVRTNEGIIPHSSPFVLPRIHLDSFSFGNHTQPRWSCPTSPGNSENSLRIPLDNKWNPTFQGDFSKDSIPWLCEPHLNLDTQATSSLVTEQRFHPTILNPCCPDASCSIFDTGLSFQGSGSSEPNSFTINPRLQFPCSPQIAGLPLDYNNVKADLSLVDHHAEKPSFGFPFSLSDAPGQSVPHRCQSSFKSSTPWLAQRVQRAKTTVDLQIFSQDDDKFFTAENRPDCLMDGSAQISLVNNPHDPVSPCSTGSSVSATQQLLAFSEFKSSSFINVERINKIEAKGKIDSKAFGPLDTENICGTNKRQAAVHYFPRKNHKITKLKVQGGLGSMKELASQNMNSKMYGNEGVHYAQTEHLMGVASPGHGRGIQTIQDECRYKVCAEVQSEHHLDTGTRSRQLSGHRIKSSQI